MSVRSRHSPVFRKPHAPKVTQGKHALASRGRDPAFHLGANNPLSATPGIGSQIAQGVALLAGVLAIWGLGIDLI